MTLLLLLAGASNVESSNEYPPIDATYTPVHDFDGWIQHPLSADVVIVTTGGGGSSIPIIDETYDVVYDYDGWQFTDIQVAGPVIRTQTPPAQNRTQTPPTQSRSTTSPSQSKTQTPPRE